MVAQSDQQNAKELLKCFEDVAKNVILDTTTDEAGIFGQLYDPESIMDSLLTVATASTTEANVGVPSLPPSVAVHSLQYEKVPFLDLMSTSGASLKYWHQIPVQISNVSNEHLRIRWIDHKYGKRSSHTFNLRPQGSSSSWKQHCSPGHLFLLSIVKGGDKIDDVEEDLFSAYDHDHISPSSQETLLTAFRPLRPLPSGSYISIVVRPDDADAATLPSSFPSPDSDSEPLQFVIEIVVHNPYDALVIAAASLDPYIAGSKAATKVKLLTTILTNLNKHSNEEKYRKLRQSNPKLQNHILSSLAAMQFLILCGFKQAYVCDSENKTGEVYLLVQKELSLPLKETKSQALKLLEILSSRAEPDFVLDLAPPTPWEPSRPVAGNEGGGANRRWAENQDRRMGFVTAEERWARAELVNRNRRNGRARRPNPGQAPSSRGNWGR